MTGTTSQWTSRFAFLMAAIGSAVGLGNLWRFPFQAGENGGAAFVFIYLFCVVFVAYPVLVAELTLGRSKGMSAVGSTRQLAIDGGRSKRWSIVGWAGLSAGLIVVTTYSVVAGQVIAYSIMSFMGEFAGSGSGETQQAASLYADRFHGFLWHTLFMVVCVGIVSRGLHGGVERLVTVLMPMFFVMLAGLCVYALATGAAREAVLYLFEPDFSVITPVIVLAAMGQAFFSVGVGGTIMVTYGSFLPKDHNIGKNAAIVAGSDTLVALIAGLMIFPIVFAYGLDPATGDQLIFSALPAVFANMTGGSMMGGVFFFLAFIAALTTVVSVFLALSRLGQEQFGLGRAASSVIFGGIVWAIGSVSLVVSGLTDWLNFAGGAVLLPIGGLLIAVFVGWVAPRRVMEAELSDSGSRFFRAWLFCIRFLAPVVVVLALLLGVDAKFDFGFAALLTATDAQ